MDPSVNTAFSCVEFCPVSHEENIARQRELYGEPLGELVRRTTTSLGLTQAQMAKTLGLSPAMLSHLVTGQRIKIANPAALTRLQAMVDLANSAPDLTAAQLSARLDAIASLSVDLTTTTHLTPGPAAPHETVARALRAVASGQQLAAAATAVEPTAPGLAELLRTYATGSPDDARRHYDRTTHTGDGPA